jgi:GMP synthase-like glutamine amidotransferase
MKIGILQCDHVREELQPIFGDYPAMIAALFAKVTTDYQFKTFQVQSFEYPQNLDECDAYITTGSRHGVNDDSAWIKRLEEFICELNQAKKTYVGICFGHQLMAKALGGAVDKSDKGWGIGVTFNQVICSKPWMEPYQHGLDLIASHQDQIIVLPNEVEVLASSHFCPYYMLLYGDHFMSVQGHPEFTKDYSAALMDVRRKQIPSNRIREGETSLKADIDNRLMAQWIVNFCSARKS